MNAPTTVRFDTAYKRLTSTERALVNQVVEAVERMAHLNQQRIGAVLDRDWQVPAGMLDDEARQILARPMVTSAIRERIEHKAAEQDLTVQWWQRELMSVARASMQDYVRMERDEFGNETPVLDLSRCTPEQWSAIKTLEVETPTSSGFEQAKGKIKVKIALWDKMAALDRIGRFIGAADADNPYWAQRGAGISNAPQLPADISVEDAGEAYARMLEG